MRFWVAWLDFCLFPDWVAFGNIKNQKFNFTKKDNSYEKIFFLFRGILGPGGLVDSGISIYSVSSAALGCLTSNPIIGIFSCVVSIGVCELGLPTIKRNALLPFSEEELGLLGKPEILGLLENGEFNIYEERDTALASAQQYLVATANRIVNLIDLISEPIGHDLYHALPNDNTSIAWLTSFANATSDSSPLGVYLSTAEIANLLATVPSVIPQANCSESLYRYNRTLTYWNMGILSPNQTTGNMSSDFMDYNVQYNRLQQYHTDITTTHQEGYNTFGDAFTAAYNNWQTVSNQKLAGICAKVTIQLDQELVVARQAFQATLTITNSGPNTITNIQVDLTITKTGSPYNNDSYNFFAIGAATMTSISGSVDDGTGSLPGAAVNQASTQGTAQWIILPTRYAAPVNATYYDVGGTLTYTLNGVTLSTKMYPCKREI